MKLWIAGKVHPNTDGSYTKLSPLSENDDYTAEEVKNFDLVDKPIEVFHRDDMVAGKIVSHWQGKGGDSHIFGYLDLDKESGRFARNLIDKRLAFDLSLGHKVTVSINLLSGQKTFKKELPHEVSIVEKSRMDTRTCRIYYSSMQEGLCAYIFRPFYNFINKRKLYNYLDAS